MERQAKDGTVYQQVGNDDWTPVTRTSKDGTVYKKMGTDDWSPVQQDASTSVEQEPEDNRNALEITRDAIDPRNMPKNLMAGLQKIDEYTGAPVRKFLTEAVTGKDLEKAPTGAEQAKMMGATDKTYGEAYGVPSFIGGNVSPADIYGVGLDLVQDPFLLAGAAVKGVKSLAGGAKGAAESFGAKQSTKVAQSQTAEMAAESSAKASASSSATGGSVEASGELFKFKSPQNLDELNNWSPSKGTGEMLGSARLKEIEAAVPDLSTKPLKYHYSMMENPKSMKELKTQFENLPTDSAKKIAAYNMEMVDESARKINETVFNISGAEAKSLPDAGFDLIDSVKQKYNDEKKALGPIFDSIQKKSYKLGPKDSRDLAVGIGQNSKIGKLLETNAETGRLSLGKNTPRSGLSDQEHGVLSRVVDDLNDGMTFKELQDTRSFLRKSIDPANPAASAEVSKVRSLMLGQLEDMAAKQGADVGETFKAYAVNERARESVEKVIGGKIETFDQMYAANPEKVVQKIFSNPNHTKVVGDYVGKDKMNQMVASYLNSGVSKSFDSAKGFQPSTLKTWLKSNSQFLKNNVEPEVVKRLDALADYAYYGKRFLDEVNPSGTAASLKAMLEPGGFVARLKGGEVVGAVKSEIGNRIVGKVQQKQAINSVNEMMGTAPAPGLMSRTGNAIKRIPDLTKNVVKFQSSAASARGVLKDVNAIRPSAENESPKKGPEKWANDGIEKLKSSDKYGILTDKVILELKKTAKGKELLFEASNVKDNKEKLDKILLKIKTSYKSGGE